MYFEKPGTANTEATLAAAHDRAQTLGLSELVIASTSGDTAYKALERFSGFAITAATYHAGFKEPFKSVMKPEVRRDLEKKGVRVISATHALSGVERSIAKKFGGCPPALLMAATLKLFGQGVKVAVEVSIMATDAGHLSGEDIIAIGGSSKGADAALVVKPAGQSNLFDLCVREVICKPAFF